MSNWSKRFQAWNKRKRNSDQIRMSITSSSSTHVYWSHLTYISQWDAIHRSKSEKDDETFINAKPWWTIQAFDSFVSFMMKEENHRYANDILRMLKNNNNNSTYQYSMTITFCLINMALKDRSVYVCENDEWFLFRVSWYSSLRTLLSIIKREREKREKRI